MDCVVDFLPDEIWDAILNGTDGHTNPILDPKWRPWAALVCQRWYRLVRGASMRSTPSRYRTLTKKRLCDDTIWTSGRVLCASSVADMLVEMASHNDANSIWYHEAIAEVARVSMSAREASPVMVSLALEGSGVPAALAYAHKTFDERCLAEIEDAVCGVVDIDDDTRRDIFARLSKWIKSNGGKYVSSPLGCVAEGEHAPADASTCALDALRALVAVRRRHPDALDRCDHKRVLSPVLGRYAYEAAFNGDLDLLDRVFALGGITRSGGSCPETRRFPDVYYDDGDDNHVIEDNDNDDRRGSTGSPTTAAADCSVPYHLINQVRTRSVRSRFARGKTVESYWVNHAVNGAIAGDRADALDLIIERAGWICVMWAAQRAIKADCVALFCVADARGLTYDARDILRSAILNGGPRVCAYMVAVLQRTQGHIEPPLGSLIDFPSSPRIWGWARDMGFTPDARWFDAIVHRHNVHTVGPWLAAARYTMRIEPMARLAVVWPAEAIKHLGALAVAAAALSTRDECNGLALLLIALERAQCDVDLWAMAEHDVHKSANGPDIRRLFFALHWLARMAHYCDPARVRVAPRTHQIDKMLGIEYARSRNKGHPQTNGAVDWSRFCRPRPLDDALVSCVHTALARLPDTLADRVYARRAHDVLAHLLNVLS
nr:hypothetical protein [Pandoravirus aubagnensis]